MYFWSLAMTKAASYALRRLTELMDAGTKGQQLWVRWLLCYLDPVLANSD